MKKMTTILLKFLMIWKNNSGLGLLFKIFIGLKNRIVIKITKLI